MRVLVLTPGVFDKGGISRYGRYQIRALRDAYGVDSVRVLSLMGRQIGDMEDPFEVDWSGPVPHTRGSRVYFAGVALRHAVIHRPDVILAQLLNLGTLAWPLSRLDGARLIQNIYGREVWSGVSPARTWALRHSDLVISDCHNSARRAVEIGLVHREPEVIWDCVDLERFTPEKPDAKVLSRYGLEKEGRFRVLFLGRVHAITRYKGTERLVRLMAELGADRFEAVIAGKGDDLEHLHGVARELGVGDRVLFPGGIHEDDLPDLYRSADAFYLVSECGPNMGEGIPLTPLEAMACGVPVVVGNQDGSREILDGPGGICCAPGDVGEQVSFLRAIRGDPARHRSERSAARRRAEAAFSFCTFSEKTREAFQRARRSRSLHNS